MSAAPTEIDGARVLYYATVDEDVQPTGNTRHLLGMESELMAPAKALAICQYPGEQCLYLFYCDEHGRVLTDTWHESLTQAMDQAEFEYRGITDRWQAAASEACHE